MAHIKENVFKEGFSRRGEGLPVLYALLPPFSPATECEIR